MVIVIFENSSQSTNFLKVETYNSYPQANAVIFEVAPAGPDASILDIFKGASEHDGNGGCGVAVTRVGRRR